MGCRSQWRGREVWTEVKKRRCTRWFRSIIQEGLGEVYFAFGELRISMAPGKKVRVEFGKLGSIMLGW